MKWILFYKMGGIHEAINDYNEVVEINPHFSDVTL